MKFTHEWNKAALLKSPLFAPLHPAIAHLSDAYFPGLAEWNGVLDSCFPDVRVKSGLPLSFVPQEKGKTGFESQYEPRCYLNGEVQTRDHNWHDLFNALVWLSFPKAKAAINARHYQALTGVSGQRETQRGSVRDMATLLDESGVIIVTSRAELGEMLCHFKWKELFWHQREQVQTEMGFYIFGHGLYEKALHPYIGMTGQGLILQVPADFFTTALSEQRNCVDRMLAAYLDDSAHCLSPRELHPVPLLGVPGWSDDNKEPGYYDNLSYFRSGRRESA
jgi:hypothetical protein